jgi:hypothetical protein
MEASQENSNEEQLAAFDGSCDGWPIVCVDVCWRCVCVCVCVCVCGLCVDVGGHVVTVRAMEGQTMPHMLCLDKPSRMSCGGFSWEQCWGRPKVQ